ncbi:MAG: hypothetical protein M1817_006355 [Caeruleum heppii]|nr:MAG: hypothetical protein M1817_006355 [Caeruleum heppii]
MARTAWSIYLLIVFVVTLHASLLPPTGDFIPACHLPVHLRLATRHAALRQAARQSPLEHGAPQKRETATASGSSSQGVASGGTPTTTAASAAAVTGENPFGSDIGLAAQYRPAKAIDTMIGSANPSPRAGTLLVPDAPDTMRLTTDWFKGWVNNNMSGYYSAQNSDPANSFWKAFMRSVNDKGIATVQYSDCAAGDEASCSYMEQVWAGDASSDATRPLAYNVWRVIVNYNKWTASMRNLQATTMEEFAHSYWHIIYNGIATGYPDEEYTLRNGRSGLGKIAKGLFDVLAAYKKNYVDGPDYKPGGLSKFISTLSPGVALVSQFIEFLQAEPPTKYPNAEWDGVWQDTVKEFRSTWDRAQAVGIVKDPLQPGGLVSLVESQHWYQANLPDKGVAEKQMALFISRRAMNIYFESHYIFVAQHEFATQSDCKDVYLGDDESRLCIDQPTNVLWSMLINTSEAITKNKQLHYRQGSMIDKVGERFGITMAEVMLSSRECVRTKWDVSSSGSGNGALDDFSSDATMRDDASEAWKTFLWRDPDPYTGDPKTTSCIFSLPVCTVTDEEMRRDGGSWKIMRCDHYFKHAKNPGRYPALPQRTALS